MTSVTPKTLAQFHTALVSELHRHRDGDLASPFTVAEIYQHLVPYRTHRDAIGVEINGDYEDALLRLLAGEGGYLRLESDVVRQELQDELKRSNPNTGLFREFAALEVRVNPASVASVSSTPAAPASGPALELELPGASAAHSVSESVPASGGTEKEAAQPPARKPAAPASPARPTPPAPSPTKAATATPAPKAAAPSGGEGGADAPTHCPDCTKALPARDSLRFCPFCGVNVRVAPCGECGEELERSWSFCVACGAAA